MTVNGPHSNSPTKGPSSDPPRRITVMNDVGLRQFISTEMWYNGRLSVISEGEMSSILLPVTCVKLYLTGPLQRSSLMGKSVGRSAFVQRGIRTSDWSVTTAVQPPHLDAKSRRSLGEPLNLCVHLRRYEGMLARALHVRPGDFGNYFQENISDTICVETVIVQLAWEAVANLRVMERSW